MGERTKMVNTGWRGSPDVWLDAAFDSLKESGIDAVRVMPLAKKINLSRTSFYWFFEDREQLLDGLIERWKAKNTGSIVRQSEAYAETISEAMLNLFDCWVNNALFDSQLEFAMRSWALQSEEVTAAIASADTARLQALQLMFERHGFNPVASDVRSRSIYLTQIGYISMKSEENIVERFRRMADYVEIFAGQRPEQRELDRFFARHGYEVNEQGEFIELVSASA